MIEIRINNLTLPVPPHLIVSREVETTLFNREAAVTDFTIPIEIPLTDEAIAALGLPHVPANPNLKVSYEAQLVIDSVFISTVTLRLLRTYTGPMKRARLSLIGDYGSFARMAGQKKVNELAMDGIRTIGALRPDLAATWAPDNEDYLHIHYTPCDSNVHMNAVANGSVTADYTFYMAADEKANLPVIHNDQDYPDEFTGYNATRSLLNQYYVFSPSDEGFSDPVKMYLETLLGVNDSYQGSDRFFWVPFFKLAYVMRRCFEEHGFTVSGPVMSDVDFAKITLYNTYAINRCTLSQALNTSTSELHVYIQHHGYQINPRNHVPDMNVVDFLLEIGKAFNLQYLYNYTNRTVEVRRLNVLQPGNNIVNLSSKVAAPPEINFEDESFTRGYQFKFVIDNDDAALRDVVPDKQGYTYRGAVNIVENLTAIASPAVQDYAYVRCLNSFYTYDGLGWTFWGHNLDDHRTSNNQDLQQIGTKAVPVVMKFAPFVASTVLPSAAFGTFTFVEHSGGWLLPHSMIGVSGQDLLGIQRPRYLNEGLTGAAFLYTFYLINWREVQHQPRLCNGLGMRYGKVDMVIPFGSVTDYDANGIFSVSCYSLFWSGDSKGLYHQHWQGLIERLAKAVQMDYKVLLDLVTYKLLDLNQTYIKIDDLLFLCRKANIPMPFPEVATLTLVRL